jgi:transposase
LEKNIHHNNTKSKLSFSPPIQTFFTTFLPEKVSEVIDLTMEDEENASVRLELHPSTSRPCKRRKTAPSSIDIQQFMQSEEVNSCMVQDTMNEPLLDVMEVVNDPPVVETTTSATQPVSTREFWGPEAENLSALLPLPHSGFLQSENPLFTPPSWFQAHRLSFAFSAGDEDMEFRAHLASLSSQETGNLPKQVVPELPKPSKRSPDKPPAGKARKVKLYPSRAQKKVMNEWFRAAEWTYNACLQAVQNEPDMLNMSDLRNHCVNSEAFQTTFADCKWVLNTPNMIREIAMHDLIQAYKTNQAKQQAQRARYSATGVKPKRWLRTFHVRPRNLNQQASQSIGISATNGWSQRRKVPYPSFFGQGLLKASQPLPEDLVYDTRLQRDRMGNFCLCLLSPLDIRQEPVGQGIVSLDPGVRTFMTGYTPQGQVIDVGKEDYRRLTNLCKRYDSLQSEWSTHEITKKRKAPKRASAARSARKNNHRHRSHLKRAGRRMQKRIHNLVEELHKKTVKYLVTNYDTILVPKFETEDMVRSKHVKRKIRSKTARSMLTWSHYRFRQRLLNKVREYPHCRVVVCSEHYTSKTCGACGYVDRQLGGKKVYSCGICGVQMDRDANAARNILIRYLVKRD